MLTMKALFLKFIIFVIIPSHLEWKECLTHWHWQIKSSGVRQSKIISLASLGMNGLMGQFFSEWLISRKENYWHEQYSEDVWTGNWRFFMFSTFPSMWSPCCQEEKSKEMLQHVKRMFGACRAIAFAHQANDNVYLLSFESIFVFVSIIVAQ